MGCNSDTEMQCSKNKLHVITYMQWLNTDRNSSLLKMDRGSAAVFSFEGYLLKMSKEIRHFPHLPALYSRFWYPSLAASPNLQPHGAERRFVDGCGRLLQSHSN